MCIESGRVTIINIFKILFLTIGMSLLASGCASVKLSMPGQEKDSLEANAGARERVALLAATRELERTPWPAVAETSLSSRMVNAMFGVKATADGMSRDEALDVYAMRLARQNYPTGALMRDANVTLRQARKVAESGRLAAAAIKPSSSDIAVLETAISNVRECREMYLAAMKELKKDGHTVAKQDQTELKEAFSQTIQDIGATADLVAERFAARRSISQFAGQSLTTPRN